MGWRRKPQPASLPQTRREPTDAEVTLGVDLLLERARSTGIPDMAVAMDETLAQAMVWGDQLKEKK